MIKSGHENSSAHDRYEGYCADLVEQICGLIKINCIIVPVKDLNYGAKSKDGQNWNGMVGELIRQVRSLNSLLSHPTGPN